MEDGYISHARIDELHTSTVTSSDIMTNRLSIDGSCSINGPTYISGGDILSHSVHQYGSGNSQGSVKIAPDEGGIFVHDGEDWVCITDTDKAKKYDAVLEALAEDYQEVLADLVLRGIVK